MRLVVAVAVAALLVPSLVSADHVTESTPRWACGGGWHPSQCGINPVGGGDEVFSEGDPSFSTDSWISGSDRVMGLVLDGDARAYPVKMLNGHEIVNDVVGGIPVAVTFCPLCGSGVVFDRRATIDGVGQQIDLTASGYLWMHDMVMWDPQTGTLWNQVSGDAIGRLDTDAKRPVSGHDDVTLTFIQSTLTTWDNWQKLQPDTTLLQPVRGRYSEHAYGAYETDCSIGISGQCRADVDGVHPKVQVVGHDDGAGGIAWPIFDIAGDGGAIFTRSDEGRGFVALSDSDGAAAVYDAGDRTFTQDEAGLWTDDDGLLWTFAPGTVPARSDGSETLSEVDSLVLFWFAWKDHHPDTELWLPAGGPEESGLSDDNGSIPWWLPVGLVAAILGAVLLFRFWRHD